MYVFFWFHFFVFVRDASDFLNFSYLQYSALFSGRFLQVSTGEYFCAMSHGMIESAPGNQFLSSELLLKLNKKAQVYLPHVCIRFLINMLKQDVGSMMFHDFEVKPTFLSMAVGCYAFLSSDIGDIQGLGLANVKFHWSFWSTIGDRIWSNHHPIVTISWRYPRWDVKKCGHDTLKRDPTAPWLEFVHELPGFSPDFLWVFLWFPQDFEGISRISDFCWPGPHPWHLWGSAEAEAAMAAMVSVEIFDPWDCYDSRIALDNFQVDCYMIFQVWISPEIAIISRWMIWIDIIRTRKVWRSPRNFREDQRFPAG